MYLSNLKSVGCGKAVGGEAIQQLSLYLQVERSTWRGKTIAWTVMVPIQFEVRWMWESSSGNCDRDCTYLATHKLDVGKQCSGL